MEFLHPTIVGINRFFFLFRYPALLLSTWIFFQCSAFIFHPTREDRELVPFPIFQEWMVDSHSGNKIRLRKFPARDSSRRTVLYLYGNSSNLTYRVSDYHWLTEEGFDLFLFDYSGYGKSTGKPSIQNLRDDTRSVMEFIEGKLKTDIQVYLGTSLGGAILILGYASYSEKDSSDQLILDCTFSSFRKMGSDVLKSSIVGWPFSWFPYLYFEKSLEPATHLDSLVETKFLVTHCERDDTVPYRHGRKLYSDLKGKKEFWSLKQCRHSAGFNSHNPGNRERLIGYLKL